MQRQENSDQGDNASNNQNANQDPINMPYNQAQEVPENAANRVNVAAVEIDIED